MSSSPPEGLIDGLTRVDEQLARANNRLEQIAGNLGGGQQPPGGEFDEIFQIEMSKLVSADVKSESPEKRVREAPTDIKTLFYVVGWPSGADQRVGVQLRTSTDRILFPRNKEDDYVGYNDRTIKFRLQTEIQEGADIITQFINNDTENSHFINATLTYKKV